MRIKKSYDISQCALYKIKGLGQLEKILGLKQDTLQALSSDSNYLIREVNQPNNKTRKIQEPKINLKNLHARITRLLSDIKIPDYLHSGITGRSYITNAKCHVGNHPVLKLDIAKFYPSVSKKSVFHFFKNELMINAGLAGLLAELCTYDNYVPTGSPVSMLLAFLASNKMFNCLNEFAISHDIVMTVYVDDITFSGKNLNQDFKNSVIKIITASGFKVKASKTRLFKINSVKTVTGCILKDNTIFPRNTQHHKAYMIKKTIHAETDKISINRLKNKLTGHLSVIKQIENAQR